MVYAQADNAGTNTTKKTTDQTDKNSNDATQQQLHNDSNLANPKNNQYLKNKLIELNSNDSSTGLLPNVTITDNSKTPQPQRATLSPEAAKKAAEELHAALNNQGFLWSANPDGDKVMRILGPLNQADMAAVEDAYRHEYNSGDKNALLDDIHQHLNDQQFREAQALLNRQDGRTNDAGNIMVALSTADSDSAKGNQLLRATYETLNAQQIAQMNTDFQKQYGMTIDQAIAKNANISDETKQAIKILEKGVENRTAQDDVTLAKMAVANGDLKMFQEAVQGNTPAAQQARQQLQNDKQFMDSFEHAFHTLQSRGRYGGPQTYSLESTNPVAVDYLKEGHVSLSTITKHDTGTAFGIFDNKDNISLACKNATDREKQLYSEGMQLSLSGKTPGTDEQKKALEYYNNLHAAFANGGNGRQVAIWEDQLLHGRDTIVTQMANTHNDGWGPLHFGAGHDHNDIMNSVENLSPADWQMLHDPKTGPQYLKEIDNSLSQYCDDHERKQIMQLLNQKAQAQTYEASGNVHRSLDQIISDSHNNGFLGTGLGSGYNEKNVVNDIAHLTPEDAAKYKNDAGFRKQIDDFVSQNMDDAGKAYAHLMLSQVQKTGKPAQEDAVSQVLRDKVDGVPGPQAMADIQKLLQDPKVRTELNKPDEQLSAQDKALKHAIQDMVFDASAPVRAGMGRGGAYVNEQSPYFQDTFMKPLLTDGKLPVTMEIKMQMPMSTIYADITSSSPSDQKAALAMLSPADQQIANNVIKNGGKLDLSDQMRSYIVDGGNYQDFKDQLSQMNPQQLDALKNEYAKKYGGDLDNDFLGKVSDSDREVYKNLLTTQSVDGRQDYYDNLIKQNFSGFSPDGTQLTAERATQIQSEALAEYQAQYKKLPRDQQLKLDEFFGTAMQQYKDSKEKLAEIAVDAAITAAALAAAPFSGGLSLGAIAAIAAGGAAFRVVAFKMIQGNDFDGSAQNIAKQAIIGGTSAALNFIGPGLFSAEIKLADTAATAVIADTAKTLGSAEMKNVSEDVLKKGISELVTKGDVSDAAIQQVVDNAAKNGMSTEAKQALTNEVKQSLEHQMPAVQEKLKQVAIDEAMKGADKTYGAKAAQYIKDLTKEMATNAAIGAGSNVVSDLIVTPLNGGKIDPQQLLESALSGAAAGSVMTILFRGAGAAYERITSHGNTNIPQGDFPVNVTKGPNNELIVNPDNNLGPIKIKHADGTEQIITQPTLLKKGDQIEGPPVDVNVIKGDDGRYYLKSGDKQVPLELGIRPTDLPSSVVDKNVFVNKYGFDIPGKVYQIGDEHFNLYRPGQQGGWWYPADYPIHGDIGGVKVHVTTENGDALAKIQKVLIPALEKDPVLRSEIADWKTADPSLGLNGGNQNFTGQRAKGFTIYVRDPANAADVAKRIDKILSDSGLSLDHPVKTGNVDGITGNSNRVGIVRDTFPQSVDATKLKPMANVDVQLQTRIESQFGGRHLSESQLRSVEQNAGLKSGTLTYDSAGKMSLKLDDGTLNYNDGIYLDESRANKTPGHLTDRPAMYALYEKYKVDPIEAITNVRILSNPTDVPAVQPASINGQKYEVGKVQVIGSGPDANIKIGGTNGSDGISRKQALVYTDQYGNTFVADLGSTSGTYINGRPIDASSDPQHPKWYKVEPADTVTIGRDTKATHSYKLDLKGPGEIANTDKPLTQSALNQSNDFAMKHQVNGQLEDGFQNSGQFNKINPDGTFDKAFGVGTVVDRSADSVLRDTIKTAEDRFRSVQPLSERMKQLTRYVHDLMSPKGWSDSDLNGWYAQFSADHAGQRALLGEFIAQGKGACVQQSMLLKVLADDLMPGAKVTLVRGTATTGGIIDHSWITVDIGSGLIVYDPRGNVYGKPLSELPNYKSGKDLSPQPAIDNPNKVRPGDHVRWNDDNGWKVTGFDSKNGDVIIKHYGVRNLTLGDLMMYPENLAKLASGEGLSPGQSFTIRRSDGTLEQWNLISYDQNTGAVVMGKEDAITDQIPRGDLQYLQVVK